MRKIIMLLFTILSLQTVSQTTTMMSRDEMNMLKAAALGNISAIQNFLKRGANINAQDPEGKTALVLALENYNPETVMFLLSQPKIDPDMMDDNFNTPLMLALRNGTEDIIALLLKKGVNVNVQNINEQTPLMVASLRGEVDIVNLMLSMGSDVNARDRMGLTPMFYAVAGGGLDVVKLLRKKGADIKVFDREGDGLLDYNCPFSDVVNYLTREGSKAKRSAKKFIRADEILANNKIIVTPNNSDFIPLD